MFYSGDALRASLKLLWRDPPIRWRSDASFLFTEVIFITYRQCIVRWSRNFCVRSGTMGKVYSSFIKRPIRNWNVGSRAQRVISQEKPQSAPRHKSTEKMIQEFTQGVGLKYDLVHARASIYLSHYVIFMRVSASDVLSALRTSRTNTLPYYRPVA